MLVAAFEATVTTGGARGETKCDDVATGDAGEATEVRMLDSGGGAGATNPVRDATESVLVPVNNKELIVSAFFDEYRLVFVVHSNL